MKISGLYISDKKKKIDQAIDRFFVFFLLTCKGEQQEEK
jgi:hypothetical protein